MNKMCKPSKCCINYINKHVLSPSHQIDDVACAIRLKLTCKCSGWDEFECKEEKQNEHTLHVLNKI